MGDDSALAKDARFRDLGCKARRLPMAMNSPRRFQEDYIGLAEAIAADRAAPPGDRSLRPQDTGGLYARRAGPNAAPRCSPATGAPWSAIRTPLRKTARRIRRVAGARRRRADAGGFGPAVSKDSRGPEER